MANSKAFLGRTAVTASFAFGEYFRPLVAVFRFFVSRHTPPKPAESTPQVPSNLEDAKAILRERLANDRHRKRSS